MLNRQIDVINALNAQAELDKFPITPFTAAEIDALRERAIKIFHGRETSAEFDIFLFKLFYLAKRQATVNPYQQLFNQLIEFKSSSHVAANVKIMEENYRYYQLRQKTRAYFEKRIHAIKTEIELKLAQLEANPKSELNDRKIEKFRQVTNERWPGYSLNEISAQLEFEKKLEFATKSRLQERLNVDNPYYFVKNNQEGLCARFGLANEPDLKKDPTYQKIEGLQTMLQLAVPKVGFFSRVADAITDLLKRGLNFFKNDLALSSIGTVADCQFKTKRTLQKAAYQHEVNWYQLAKK